MIAETVEPIWHNEHTNAEFDSFKPELIKKFISFRLNREMFALPITDLKEIIPSVHITKLPAVSRFVAGVIELRGEVISVLDLHQRLNMKHGSTTISDTVLIVQDGDTLAGLKVDDIAEAFEVNENCIEVIPASAKSAEEIITNVIKYGNQLLSLVNTKKLLLSHFISSKEENKSMIKKIHHAASSSAETVQLVTFSIQEDEFAVNIKDVQEINKLMDITHVPRAPKFVEGVINLRGQVVPVINLRDRFNIPKIKYDKNTRIIIIQANNRQLGMIVDTVSEVLRVPAASLKNPPTEAIGENAAFVSSIAEWNQRLIIVLNLEKVLSEEEAHDISEIKHMLAGEETSPQALSEELV